MFLFKTNKWRDCLNSLETNKILSARNQCTQSHLPSGKQMQCSEQNNQTKKSQSMSVEQDIGHHRLHAEGNQYGVRKLCTVHKWSFTVQFIDNTLDISLPTFAIVCSEYYIIHSQTLRIIKGASRNTYTYRWSDVTCPLTRMFTNASLSLTRPSCYQLKAIAFLHSTGQLSPYKPAAFVVTNEWQPPPINTQITISAHHTHISHSTVHFKTNYHPYTNSTSLLVWGYCNKILK